MGSINFENEPILDEEEPNDNAMPPNEQPHYWTDYLALEQERYNQRLQWENKWLISLIHWVLGSMNLPPLRTH
ncbi:hypothetical protein ACSBR2_041399 [Camellia fascicularis]